MVGDATRDVRMIENERTKVAQWGWWVVVVFVLQVIFFCIGSDDARQRDSPSSVKLKSVYNPNLLSWLALEDPVALSRPNKHGFSGVWLRPPHAEHQLARWVPPDVPIPGQSNLVIDLLAQVYMEGSSADAGLFVKPPPVISTVVVPPLRMENSSRLAIKGALAGRALTVPVSLISDWQVASILAPSHVQVVVDSQGRVLSGVLLESSGHKPADVAALEISLKRIFFEKSAANNDSVEAGDLLFYWHADPSYITNIVEKIP